MAKNLTYQRTSSVPDHVVIVSWSWIDLVLKWWTRGLGAAVHSLPLSLLFDWVRGVVQVPKCLELHWGQRLSREVMFHRV